MIDSIKAKEPREIVQSTLELALKSDQLVHNLSEAVRAIDFVRENATAKQLGPEDRRRLASEYWVKQRDEAKTAPNKIEDRIIVDSIAKFIHRGRHQ